MNKYCNNCEHKKKWFSLERRTDSNSLRWNEISPFQYITDAETNELQVFISVDNPCYKCKHLFEDGLDNYEEGLKKCPFCGSSATVYFQDRGNIPGKDYLVCCSNNSSCGIETAPYATKKEAIDAWNRKY